MKMVVPRPSQIYEGLRVLNPLSRGRLRVRERLLSNRPDSAYAEAFRLLALNLSVLLANRHNKAVAVMSPYPGDGRSSIAANLAIALSEHSRVLLVDSQGDEEGSLSYLLGNGRSKNGNEGPNGLPPTAQVTDVPNVWLMPGGAFRAAHAPLSLQSLLSDVSDDGIISIVDTPPAAKVSAAFLLAREVGQAIYVVRDRQEDMGVHRGIREQLKRLSVEILGLVTNEG